MIKTVFLDLDGVLVDFLKGACEIHNIKYDYNQYSFKVNDFFINRQVDISDEDFFKPLDENFWMNLEWIDDGKEILSIVESFSDNLFLLTSPAETPGCLEGKRKWIKQNIPHYEKRVLYGTPKHACAHASALLIDDSNHNHDSFIENGGNCILVPRKWNRLFTVKNTVKYISAQLEQYKDK